MIEAHSLNDGRFALAKEYGAREMAHGLRLNQWRHKFDPDDSGGVGQPLLGIEPRSQYVTRKPLELGDMCNESVLKSNRLDQPIYEFKCSHHFPHSHFFAERAKKSTVTGEWQDFVLNKGTFDIVGCADDTLPAVAARKKLKQIIADYGRALFTQDNLNVIKLNRDIAIPDFHFFDGLATEGLHMSLRQYDMLCVLALCAVALMVAPWSVVAASCFYLLALLICAEANRKFLSSQNASPFRVARGPVRTGKRGGT